MKVPFLLGRLLFGGFFVYNGINHFRQRKTLAQYAGAKKVPAPDAAVIASGVAMLAGGASVLLGGKPKLGLLAIIAFLGAVSPLMHDFWRAEDPQQRMNDRVNFYKNLALLGAGLALMAVEEPWPVSVAAPQPTLVSRVHRSVRTLAA